MPVRNSLGQNPGFASKSKSNMLKVILFLVAIGFILRLTQLQLIEGGEYRTVSENQAIKKVIVDPFRGNMFDRDSNLIVHNEPSFTITLTPNNFDIKALPLLLSILPLDTLEILQSASLIYGKHGFHDEFLPEISKLIDTDTTKLQAPSARAGYYSRFTPIKIYRDANYEELATIEEFSDYLPGINVIVESKRLYDYPGRMGHILGYTREISPRELERYGNYRPGDLIGKRGLELSYEKFLRGQYGVQFVAVNSAGRKISSFEKGKKDLKSKNGFDLYLGIDTTLQSKAEKLLENESGGIVIIEPKSGEIMALASSPGFDPRDFTGKISHEFYDNLYENPKNPLYNRCIQARNSPGSTWKMLIALAGLDAGIIDLNSKINCQGGMKMGRRFFRCHGGAHGNIDVRTAIQVSCNTFFYKLNYRLGIDKFGYYGKLFGFGKKTGIDLPGENRGILPTEEWLKNNPRSGGFQKGKLLNYGIGQGEILVTPIQMAVYVAAIANKGTVHQPHIVRAVRNNLTNRFEKIEFQSQNIGIPEKYFDAIRDGMNRVTKPGGTARSAAVPGIDVCGKTGTAQNPHGRDHAWFVFFAPKDNPEIAGCVFVENAGYGGVKAAPMARELMMDYFYPGHDQKKTAPADSLQAPPTPADTAQSITQID